MACRWRLVSPDKTQKDRSMGRNLLDAHATEKATRFRKKLRNGIPCELCPQTGTAGVPVWRHELGVGRERQ